MMLSTESVRASDRTSGSSLEQLKARCALLWKRLEQNKPDLNVGADIPDNFRRLSLLLATESRLKNEIDTVSDLSLEKIEFKPRETELMEVLVKNEVEQRVQQLREGLQSLHDELRETTAAVESEKILSAEHQQVHQLLSKQKEKQVSENNSSPEQSLSNELHRLTDQNKHYIEHIKQFIHTFYPPPSDVEIRTLRERPEYADQEDMDTAIPLVDMLETLLILSVSRPENPYIDIRRGYWPPYAELLLRSGIACQHPSEPHRLRLYDFSG